MSFLVKELILNVRKGFTYVQKLAWVFIKVLSQNRQMFKIGGKI